MLFDGKPDKTIIKVLKKHGSAGAGRKWLGKGTLLSILFTGRSRLPGCSAK